MDYDVTVVGAGPAGAATATLMAREGYQVLLLDKARFPRDKICGEALSPAALPILERLGVLGSAVAQGFPLRGARLTSPEGRSVEARYPFVPGVPDHGLALPRLVLDPMVIDSARREPGVTFLEGTEAKELVWDGDRCTGLITREGPVRSRAVVLAEGRFSKLHPNLARSPRKAEHRRRVFVATFDGVEGLSDMLELSVRRRDLQAIVSPQGRHRAALSIVLTGGEATNLGSPPIEGMLRILREEPAMEARLRHAEPICALKGLILDPYQGDPVPADGLVAVGDCTGFFDPLTGEGMYRALRSAELVSEVLARALRAGHATRSRLSSYRRHMESEFTWTYRFVRSVVWLTGSETGTNLAIRALQRHPELAARMVAYQGAMIPAHRFFPDLLRLAVAPRTWVAAIR